MKNEGIPKWRTLPDGTPVYLFIPPHARARGDGATRNGRIHNDPNDETCIAFGPAIMIGEKPIYDIGANTMVFLSETARDLVANWHAVRSVEARAKHNAPEARQARQDAQDARDNAREESAIRHEIDKMNDALS
jgi:hypothetical protein